MKVATLLVDIVRLHQRTKNPLRYVQTNSKYGHIVAIPDYDAQEYSSRSEIEKVWVEKIILRFSRGKD